MVGGHSAFSFSIAVGTPTPNGPATPCLLVALSCAAAAASHFIKKISDSVETSALRPTAALLLLAARRVRSRSPFYLYIYYVSFLLVYYHYWHYYCIVVSNRIPYNIITITIVIITDYSWIYLFLFFFFSPRHADVQTARPCVLVNRVFIPSSDGARQQRVYHIWRRRRQLIRSGRAGAI